MSVNVIVPTILIASTSYVQPVFETSYINPIVSATSYVQPVFEANYLQINVAAEVTMPDFLGVEILTPTDLVSLETSKSVADSANTTDSALKNITKPRSDGLTALDFVYTQTVFNRAFVEFLAPPDTIALASYSAKYETVVPIDDTTVNLSKALADTSSIVDMMDGDIQYLLIKVLSDFPSAIDAQIIDFSTEKADNIATIDSGVLSMQDYCDITYFLEDYVGFSTTFT